MILLVPVAFRAFLVAFCKFKLLFTCAPPPFELLDPPEFTELPETPPEPPDPPEPPPVLPVKKPDTPPFEPPDPPEPPRPPGTPPEPKANLVAFTPLSI